MEVAKIISDSERTDSAPPWRAIRPIYEGEHSTSIAAMELKLGTLRRALERHYRVDQPRAPAGTPDGGQWIADGVHVAGVRCDGFSAGCRNGGTFGSSGMVRIGGRLYCWDCAIKFLGIQNMHREEQMETIKKFDPLAFDGGK